MERALTVIESLDDPRVADYRNLKDRELAQTGKRFIAEGAFLVRRLLASEYPVRSVLMNEQYIEEFAPLVPSDIPVYVAPWRLLNEIIGFNFHMGIIACGYRKPMELVETAMPPAEDRLTVVVLSGINNPENIGGLLRLAGGFGAAAVVLGPGCCDPFYRQAIRVSMGAVFRLRLLESANLGADMAVLCERWGVETAATVLDENAEPLAEARRGDRLALVFGSEGQGLSANDAALCDRQITIPMKLGTDSLNVAVAAGIFLYHFTSPQAWR